MTPTHIRLSIAAHACDEKTIDEVMADVTAYVNACVAAKDAEIERLRKGIAGQIDWIVRFGSNEKNRKVMESLKALLSPAEPEKPPLVCHEMTAKENAEAAGIEFLDPQPPKPVPDENGLLPCPFCGGKAEIKCDHITAWEVMTEVGCNDCHLGFCYLSNVNDKEADTSITKEQWNRRAGKEAGA
jgi:hypothetical protein